MDTLFLINNKRILAIIPARSKSKGLRHKNIKKFNGKPLLIWTVSQALNSKYIDEIFVSTDSNYYKKIVENFGLKVPILRPKYLSKDAVSSFDVIEHVIKKLVENGKFFDYVILLEPTSPIRKKTDIDNVIKKFHKHSKKIDGLITVGNVSQLPSLTFEAVDEVEMKKYFKKIKFSGRRQDEIQLYTIFAVAYIFKIDKIIKAKSLNLNKIGYFKVEKYQEIEIDDIVDFNIAEFLFRKYC